MTFDGFETSDETGYLSPYTGRAARAGNVEDLLAVAWASLKRGGLVARAIGQNDTHAWLVLRRPVTSSLPKVDARRENALDAVLLGCSQKVVTFDHRMHPSTLAFGLRSALARMGVECSCSRAPLAIPLFAHAVAGPGTVPAHVTGAIPVLPDGECAVVFERVEESLRGLLSPREFTVARGLIEGKNYAEMAGERHASTRTIANQICSIGRKLGTRGRFDLLRVAVRMSGSKATPRLPDSDGKIPMGRASTADLGRYTLQRGE
jgi:DNA-binding CsgD family transcriptional regulator